MTPDDHERMRALYQPDEHGYSLGQSLDRERERRWRLKFLAATLGPAAVLVAIKELLLWWLS